MLSPTSYEGKYDSFHEFMKHAYARLFLFFAFFGIVALSFGIWGYLTIQPIQSPSDSFLICNRIDNNLKLFSLLLFVQAAISLLLSFALYKFNSCFHYVSTLVLTACYLSVIAAETAIVAIGFSWLNSGDAAFCKSSVSKLYNDAYTFCFGILVLLLYFIILVAIIVFGIQFIAGTFFLIYYGLFTANYEASAMLSHSTPEEEILVKSI